MKYAYRFNQQRIKAVHILDGHGSVLCNPQIIPRGPKYTFTNEVPAAPLCVGCLKRASTERSKAKVQRRKPRATPLNNDFYASWEWAKVRYEVLKAYGPICMCCRATDRIVIDHILSRRKRPDLELDFDNLQVLCDACNKGKSWDDETDFRPKCPEPELEPEQMAHLKSILN